MRQVEELYHGALALPRDQRAEFLAQACAEDDALRAEVESLLSCEKAAESFMETPAFQKHSVSSIDGGEAVSTDLAGCVIGRSEEHTSELQSQR